jgi:U3 small nucleolar RNA-associated protein 25
MEEFEGEDQFDEHFKYELSADVLAAASEKKYTISKQTWPSLNELTVKSLDVSKQCGEKATSVMDSETVKYSKIPGSPRCVNSSNLKGYQIKSQILENVLRSNTVHVGESNLSSLQLELLSIMHEYRDLYFTRRTFSNAEQIRFAYCLHAINHALKVRLKIIHHNARITNKSEVSDEYRDQGLVRPRILIVVPFKDSALK